MSTIVFLISSVFSLCLVNQICLKSLMTGEDKMPVTEQTHLSERLWTAPWAWLTLLTCLEHRLCSSSSYTQPHPLLSLLSFSEICPFVFTHHLPLSLIWVFEVVPWFRPTSATPLSYLRKLSSLQLFLFPLGLTRWPHLLTLPCFCLPDCFNPRAHQAVQASFHVWVLFIFLSPPLALFLRTCLRGHTPQP